MSDKSKADATETEPAPGTEAKTGEGAAAETGAAPDSRGARSGFVETNRPVRRTATREADHASVRESRQKQEADAQEAKTARSERRKRIRSGHLEGTWVVVGNTLVNMNAAAKIDLPTEGDENGALTITTFGGQAVSASGDEAKELMEELGLEPVPAPVKDASDRRGTVNENGRIVSPRDAAVETENPDRVRTVPTGMHRANATLDDAETEHEVKIRAGAAPVPPTREPGEARAEPVGDETGDESHATGEPSHIDGGIEGDDAEETGADGAKKPRGRAASKARGKGR